MDYGREFWNEEYKESPKYVMVQNHFLGKEIDGVKTGKALDLGCGKGDNCIVLAEHGFAVTGVDWSEEAIRLAQESAKEKGLDIQYICSDITTWEPKEKYELVISTYALPEGEGKRKVLETAVDALDEKGVLIIMEWHKGMAEVWDMFDENELTSPEEIIQSLEGMVIENAEVRYIENKEQESGDMRKGDWQIAFVKAHKE